MTLEQQPEPISFAGNLKEFILSSVTANTPFVLETNGQIIIDEVYAPDASGKITIDLQSVITPMFSLVLPDYFSFGTVQENAVKKFTAKIGTDSYDFTVVRGGVANLNQSTADFLKYNFLTWQPQVKEIFLRQPEFLSYYSAEPSTLKIKAYFEDGSSETHDQILITSKVMTCNMNYDIINSYFTKQVSYYDAYVANSEGERLTYIQRYVPVPEPDAAQIYLFHNTLAGIDTLICTGTLTQTPSTQSALVTMSQETTDNDIEYEITCEQNTGILKSAPAALWLRDFFVSSYRCHFTDAFRRIYIEESENAYTPFEINSYTFEYRYSKQTIYNNVSRNRDTLPRLLEFPTPDKLFFLTPRLSEYPVAAYADDLQIPVQNPYTSAWYRIAAKNLGGGGGQGGGSEEGNFWSKDELTAEELYLLLEGEKIKAGFADFADDAGKWCGKTFEDYFNAPLRTTDHVQFKTVKTESVTTSSFATPTFVAGFGGSGTRLKDDHLELNSLTVRKQMTVRELIIEKVKSVGGTLIVSIGAMKITAATDGGTYFKCNFDNDGGNIDNPFVVDDLVMCQTFSGSSIKRYWRRVTSVAVDFFNLSKTDCEAGSAEPAAGDEIVQLGNRTDASRQSAMILCAVGADAPYIDQYAGINNFTLAGKLITREGNLSGIVDDALGQLSGSGLYAKNAYLRGKLALASGKTVENALGEIDTKTGTAQSTAETAQQTANNAASELSKTNTTLSTVTRDVKLLADTQSGFSVSVSEVREKAEAAQDAVNNIRAGNVNLLNNSKSFKVGAAANGITSKVNLDGTITITSTVGNGTWFTAFLPNMETSNLGLQEGEDYCVVYWVKTNATSRFSVYINSNNSYVTLNGVISSTEYKPWYVVRKYATGTTTQMHLGFPTISGSFTIQSIMICKGNIPPDSWSPSFGDVQAEIVAVETDANEAKVRLAAMSNDGIISKEEKTTLCNDKAQIDKEFAKYQQEAVTYGVSVTAIQTAYNALVNFLTGTVKIADATDYTFPAGGKDTYNKCFADYYSARSAFANLIATKVASTAVDGIQTGVVNIFNNSGNFTDTIKNWIDNGGGLISDSSVKYNGYNTIRTTVGIGIQGDWYKLENGVEYCYFAMIKTSENVTGNASTPLHYWIGKDNYNQGKRIVIKYDTDFTAGEWKLAYVVFKLTHDANSFKPFIYIGTGSAIFNIAFLGLTKGNKPTPSWSPSLADQQAETERISQLKADAERIKAEAYADGIVTAEEQRAIADAQAKYNAAVSEAQKKVDNIKIGARNLLLKSNVGATGTGYPFKSYKPSVAFVKGRTYTAIMNGKSTSSGGMWMYIGGQQLIASIQSSTEITVSNTFIPADNITLTDAVNIYHGHHGSVGSSTVNWVMLFEGNKAPETWIAAPEDIQEAVDVVRTELTAEIKAVNGSITNLVTRTEYNALGQRVSHAEGRIETTAFDITLTVKKANIISSINQSAEAIRISASRIEITGQTIFRDTSNNQTFSVFGSGGYALNLNNKFKVTTFGKLYATEAEITGKITSGEGKIGGFAIGANYLENAGLQLTGGAIIYNDSYRTAKFGIYTASGYPAINYNIYVKNNAASTQAVQQVCAYFERDTQTVEILRGSTALQVYGSVNVVGSVNISGITNITGNIMLDVSLKKMSIKGLPSHKNSGETDSFYYLGIHSSTNRIVYIA